MIHANLCLGVYFHHIFPVHFHAARKGSSEHRSLFSAPSLQLFLPLGAIQLLIGTHTAVDKKQ